MLSDTMKAIGDAIFGNADQNSNSAKSNTGTTHTDTVPDGNDSEGLSDIDIGMFGALKALAPKESKQDNTEGASTTNEANPLWEYLGQSVKDAAVKAEKSSAKDMWQMLKDGEAFSGKSLFDIILEGKSAKQADGQPEDPSVKIIKAVKDGQFKEQFNQLLGDILGKKVDVFGTLQDMQAAASPEEAKAIADKADPQVLSILGTFGSDNRG